MHACYAFLRLQLAAGCHEHLIARSACRLHPFGRVRRARYMHTTALALGPAEPQHALPAGCSAAEARPFFATVDAWGGDAARRPTCKLRCVCAFRQSEQHVMVSDHMWLDGADAAAVMAIVPTPDKPVAVEAFGSGARPARGTKLFLVAKCAHYAPGKAKLYAIERIEPVAFEGPGKQAMYWAHGMPRDSSSALWHGGGGGGSAHGSDAYS